MYICQNMGHTYHKKIQEITDLDIVNGLPNRIPQLTVTFPIFLIAKDNQLIRQPTFSTYGVVIGNLIQAGFTFFNDTSI